MSTTVATVDEWIQSRTQNKCQPIGTRSVELVRELAEYVTGWVTSPVFDDPFRGRVECSTRMCPPSLVREFFTKNSDIWLLDLTMHEDRVFIRGDWIWDLGFYSELYSVDSSND